MAGDNSMAANGSRPARPGAASAQPFVRCGGGGGRLPSIVTSHAPVAVPEDGCTGCALHSHSRWLKWAVPQPSYPKRWLQRSHKPGTSSAKRAHLEAGGMAAVVRLHTATVYQGWLPCVYCSHIRLEDLPCGAALQLGSSAILRGKMAVRRSQHSQISGVT